MGKNPHGAGETRSLMAWPRLLATPPAPATETGAELAADPLAPPAAQRAVAAHAATTQEALARLVGERRSLASQYRAALEEADADRLIAIRQWVIDLDERIKAATVQVRRAALAAAEAVAQEAAAALVQAQREDRSYYEPGVFRMRSEAEDRRMRLAADRAVRAKSAHQRCIDEVQACQDRVRAVLNGPLPFPEQPGI